MTVEEYASLMNEMQDSFRTVAMSLTMMGSDATLRLALEVAIQASDVGWAFDPTTYRERMRDGGLERQRRMIKLAIRVRRDLRALFPGDAAFWDALAGQTGKEAKP